MRKLLAIMMVILSALFVSLDTAEAAPGSYIFVENWFDANYSHKNSVEKVLMEKAYSLYGKTMKNGRNGCTEASVLLGSNVSPLLEEARQAGIVYNPYLKDFAKSHGYDLRWPRRDGWQHDQHVRTYRCRTWRYRNDVC